MFAQKKNPPLRALFGQSTRELQVQQGFLNILVQSLNFVVKHGTSYHVAFFSPQGLDTVGIFRICGSRPRLLALKEAVDKDPINFIFPPDTDEILVTDLLKVLFRETPDPIFTFELYDMFIAASTSPLVQNRSQKLTPTSKEHRNQLIKKCLHLLPMFNQMVLELLFKMLHKIAEYSHIHSMTATNLAVCIGPNLLKPLDNQLSIILEDSSTTLSLISLLISDYPTFFSKEITNETLREFHVVEMGATSPKDFETLASPKNNLNNSRSTRNHSDPEKPESKSLAPPKPSEAPPLKSQEIPIITKKLPPIPGRREPMPLPTEASKPPTDIPPLTTPTSCSTQSPTKDPKASGLRPLPSVIVPSESASSEQHVPNSDNTKSSRSLSQSGRKLPEIPCTTLVSAPQIPCATLASIPEIPIPPTTLVSVPQIPVDAPPAVDNAQDSSQLIEQLRNGYIQHRNTTRRHREHVRKESQLSEEEMAIKMKRLTVCYLQGVAPEEEEDIKFFNKITNVEFKAKLEKIISQPRVPDPNDNDKPSSTRTQKEPRKEKKESKERAESDCHKSRKTTTKDSVTRTNSVGAAQVAILNPSKKELDEAIKKQKVSQNTTKST